MTGRAIRRLLAVAAIAAAAAPVWAQGYEEARAIAAEARQAAASGRWAAAEDRLLAGRRGCNEGPAGRRCRLLLDFNLGYVYEQHGRSDAGRQRELLDASATAYRRVLEEVPGHAATLNNLALVLSRLDRIPALEDLLARARLHAPREAGGIAMLIGETHAAASRWPEAFDAYVTAGELMPHDAAARFKVVEAYGAQPGDRTGRFLGLVKGWEQSFPAAAREGYRAVVRARYADSVTDARTALLGWVAMAAETRLISSAVAADAFKDVPFGPVAGLVAFLELLEREEPGRFRDVHDVDSTVRRGPPGGQFGSWTRDRPGRHALGMAALAMGRDAVVAQNPGLAERQWILGLQFAPTIEDYLLGQPFSDTFLPLELVTELTWIQFRYPVLDPGGNKFRRFLELLFDSKAQAYEASDLRAIQRHHTVLGEIFAARNVWKSDWADNAVFQLSHALRAAERRRAQDGLYQPLPGLKALLAQGYDKIGRRDEALATAVDAAQAYLDTDDLDRADEMLKRAPSAQAPAPERARIEALREILGFRQTIRLAAEAARRGREADAALTAERIERGIGHVRGVPADFLARQMFKVDADLAELGSMAPALLSAETRARLALSRARQTSTLVGMGDVLRLERVTALAAGESVTPRGTPAVQLVAGAMPPADRPESWTVALLSSDRAAYALVKDLGLKRPSKAGPWLVYFAHDSAALSSDAREFLTELRAEPGVVAASTIRIVGRSDTKGDPAYNLVLSKKRAGTVADYLVQQGVPRTKIVVEGIGEESPVIPAGDDTPMARNRVVEIRLE